MSWQCPECQTLWYDDAKVPPCPTCFRQNRLDKHSLRVREAEDSIHDLTKTQIDQLRWQASISSEIITLRKELDAARRKRSNNTKLIVTLLLAVVPIANAAATHFWSATIAPEVSHEKHP